MMTLVLPSGVKKLLVELALKEKAQSELFELGHFEVTMQWLQGYEDVQTLRNLIGSLLVQNALCLIASGNEL